MVTRTLQLPHWDMDKLITDCSTKMLAKECKKLNGTCNIQTDGYYIVSSASVIIAVLLAFFYIMPNVYILERLSPKKWRLSSAKISQSKKR